MLKPKIKKISKDEVLLPKTISFLEDLNCIIQRQDSVKKNREHNFKILIPTEFGPVPYFVKVRNKKKCDDKDLSAAYMEAEVQRLPLLFLYTGQLHEKAEVISNSERFESLLTRKIPWD